MVSFWASRRAARCRGAVVRIADQRAIGLVTIGPDHRCEGRAEVSYQLLPSAWGQCLGREAAAAIAQW
ncbi:GNAT family N-acetyltransferase [Streptomyces sp. NPDC055089]